MPIFIQPSAGRPRICQRDLHPEKLALHHGDLAETWEATALWSLYSLQPQNPMTGTYLTQLPFPLLYRPPLPFQTGESNPWCCELWLTEALAQTISTRAKETEFSAAVNDPGPARDRLLLQNMSKHFSSVWLQRFATDNKLNIKQSEIWLSTRARSDIQCWYRSNVVSCIIT